MPSELSEQGHHTNPAQNQLVMNEEYKRMLAYLLYWSILDYHQIERPVIDQLAGQIRDLESLEPINGAQVQVGQFNIQQIHMNHYLINSLVMKMN